MPDHLDGIADVRPVIAMTDTFTQLHPDLLMPAEDAGAESAFSSLPSLDFREFADSLPEIVWMTDARGRGIFFNRAWYNYLGVGPGPEARVKAWEAIHPDDRTAVAEEWEGILVRGGSELRYEFRLRGKDGIYRWFFAHGFAQKDPATDETLRWVGISADIEVVKQAQVSRQESQALAAQSEARLRLAVEAANLGMWELDVTTGEEYWSAKAAAMIGRPEMSGRVGADIWRNILHPDDRAPAQSRFDVAMRSGGDTYDNEYRILMPDGVSCRHFVAKGTIVRDSAGVAMRVVGFSRDISDEKHVLTSLQNSEQRYRALIDASSQVVWTNTADGKMIGEQQGWSALTGQTEAEYSGYGWAEAVHPDDAEPTIAAWNESVRTRTPFLFEHRVRRRDGAWGLFSIRAVPVLYPSGEIREWVGIHTDITGDRKAEKEQRETFAQLSAVLESATDGIVVADMAGEILMMNPAGLALHGFSSNEEARRNLRDYPAQFTLHAQSDDVIPLDRWPLARVLNGETFTEYECRVCRLDTGTEWWASYSGSPARDEHGAINLVVLTVRDVSERKRIEAQRDGLLRRIEEAAERQRKFLRDMLSSMSEGRLRLCDSVADLPSPITPEPADKPVTLEKNTVRVLRHQTVAACQGAGLPPEREDDLVTAVGEASMNAVVHAGGGTGSVYCDRERGVVQVWVRDTGTGINEDSLHRATLEKGFTTAGTLGHGFWMMLKTADRIYLLTGASGTTVVIEQERQPPIPSWMQSYKFVG